MEKWLQLFYQGKSNAKIASELKMGRKNLVKNYVIPHFGFNPTNTERLHLIHKQELDDLITLYKTKTNLSFKDVCNTSELNYSLISKYFDKLNVKRTFKGRDISSYVDNHDLFFDINSELEAYLLGFFLADGHLEHTKEETYAIRIGVQIADSHILELYKKALHSPKYSIRVNNDNTASLVFRSYKIGQTLMKMGIDSHKTHTLKALPKINPDLIHHLIRGYFDGDGCISVCARREGNRLNGYNKQFSIAAGNIDILTDICRHLHIDTKNILYKEAIVTNVQGHSANFKPSYNISIRDTATIILLHNFLYKDATYYFKRKKDKFDLAMLNSSEINAVLQGNL